MTKEIISFGVFVTVLGALISLYYKYFITILKENKTRSNLVTTLQRYDAITVYKNWLSIILDKLDSFLGKPTFSFIFIRRNILFHYIVSILYIFIVFFIIWLFGGNNAIGNLALMPDMHSWIERFFILFKFIIIISLTLYIISNPSNTLLKKYIKSAMLYYVLMIVAILIILVIGIGDKFDIPKVNILGINLFFGISSLEKGDHFFNLTAYTLFIFILFIPFPNAILDFLSLTLSRIFFRYISKGEAWYKITIHLLLDICVALLFMLALLALLYYIISYINTLVDTSLQIPITQMLHNALQDPFSLDNAWISFMVLSTLIPTILHLIFALLHFLLYIFKLAPWYAKRIDKSKKYFSQRMFTAFIMATPLALLSMVVVYIVYLCFIKFITLL